MGFLNPLFLIAGIAVLAPILLHLFFRRRSRSISFPAILYLVRTQRDHARRIRSRQLLLLLLRVALVLLIVLMGARIYWPGPAGSHPPTAVAIILDNSLSASVITEGRRVLDALKEAALATVEEAGPEDRIWVMRAAEPWERPGPADPRRAAERIRATQPSEAASNLNEALIRARGVLSRATEAGREIHLFSDLQESSFSASEAVQAEEVEEVPVLAYQLRAPEFGGNRAISELYLDGGFLPRAGRRTHAIISVAGPFQDEEIGARILLDERVRATGRIGPGGGARIALPPLASGTHLGYAEIDPDPLAGDDRRYFAWTVGDARSAALAGTAPVYVREAIEVLIEHEWIALSGADQADVLLSVGGEGIGAWRPGQDLVVLPPEDDALLPALNRRLQAAGIPFRYALEEGPASRLAAGLLPWPGEELQVHRFFPLLSAEGAEAQRSEFQLEIAGAGPWLLSATAPRGGYTLLASTLEGESTSLPLSAAMVPFMEWLLRERDGPGARGILAGDPLPPRLGATHVVDPLGNRTALDSGLPFPATGRAGFYELWSEDSLLSVTAVNAPAEERDPKFLNEAEAKARIAGLAGVIAGDLSEWRRRIFRLEARSEPWRALIACIALLLALESLARAPKRIEANSD